MFGIYGVTGPTFRGTLETMAQLPGVMRSRSARGFKHELDELGPEIRLSGLQEAAVPADLAQAAAAYAKMLIQPAERGPLLHAYQVMSRDVLTLRPADTVAMAWQALAARGVSQAPVLNVAREVVGLVSDRDLLTVLDLAGVQLTGRLDATVGEVMVTPVVGADPVTDIRRIARVLLDTGLSALPVVSESRELLGVVSRGDILRAALADPPLSLWV